MTDTAVEPQIETSNGHGHHAPPPRPTGIHRFTAPGLVARPVDDAARRASPASG